MLRWLVLLAACGAAPAFAQEIGDPAQGLAFARQTCAACHAVEPTDGPSPNGRAPSFVAIARTKGLTATALYVSLQTSHKTMPDLILEPKEIRDVSAYILSLP